MIKEPTIETKRTMPNRRSTRRNIVEEVDTPLRESIRDRDNTELVDQLVDRMNELRPTKKDFKPPMYNGDTDVELFITQFQDVSIVNRWEPLETLLHLRSCLQGKATDCGRETTLHDTYSSLRARFGLTPKQAREQLKTIKKKPKQSYHELSSEISRLENRPSSKRTHV